LNGKKGYHHFSSRKQLVVDKFVDYLGRAQNILALEFFQTAPLGHNHSYHPPF
jgi:hypothetical protein